MKPLKVIKYYFNNFVEEVINPVRVYKKPKIFCVGRNKTGTTSLNKAFTDLGFVVGNQRKAEKLARYYHIKDFKPIINYCRTAQVFQDVPFSWPDTFIEMDIAFPDAKFILSVRDSAEQWYNSLINFMIKLFGKLPAKEDLMNAKYVYKGWFWENLQSRFGKFAEKDPWNKEMHISDYMNHNEKVKEYFHQRPGKLLVINLAEKDSYSKFIEFLNIKSLYSEFPWENKTDNLKIRLK